MTRRAKSCHGQLLLDHFVGECQQRLHGHAKNIAESAEGLR
jgi:hypothetical protein